MLYPNIQLEHRDSSFYIVQSYIHIGCVLPIESNSSDIFVFLLDEHLP